MKTPRLETERMLLREIQAADAQEVFSCWMQDEAVSRYMWWKACGDIAAAEAFVSRELTLLNSDKWYRWLIERKKTGQLIGTCLVFLNEEDTPPHWDISYNLGQAFWGKGYITEAMRTAMAFATAQLGMEECLTTYAKVNTASANVLHKLGFKDLEAIPYECSGGEVVTDGMLCRYRAKPLPCTHQNALKPKQTPGGERK